MAKTYQNAIDEARELTQDSDSAGYRNANTVYYNKLNRALQELGRIRPDAFWDEFLTDDIVIPEISAGNVGDDFEPPMQFYLPVVVYIAGSIEMIDDEFATDGRAVALLTAFKSSVLAL